MPANLPAAPEKDAPIPRLKEASGGVVFVNRTAGWIVALLLLGLLAGVAYVGTSLFTRELQFDRLREEVRHLNTRIENLDAKQMELERRLVQLETEAENRKDQRP